MKYVVILDHVGLFSVAMMCRVLEVYRSGFYRSIDRPRCDRDSRGVQMEDQAKNTYEEFEAAY